MPSPPVFSPCPHLPMRSDRRFFTVGLCAAAVLLSPAVLVAQAPGSERVVVGIVDQFRQATANWPDLFRPYAEMLLLGLLTLEAYLSWADWQTRQIGLERMVAESVRKLGVIGVVWAFFTNPLFGPDQIISFFRFVGARVAGVSNTDNLPGDLVLQGFSLADVLLRAASQAMGELMTAWWEISRSLIEQGAVDSGFLGMGVLVAHLHAARFLAATVMLQVVFSTIVVGLGVVVLEASFAFVALQQVLAELEIVLLIGFAPFFAGFVAFRVTAGIPEAVLKQRLVLGLRVFLTMPLASLGLKLAALWSQNLLASVTRRTLASTLPVDGRTVHIAVQVVYLDPIVVVLVLISVCFYSYLVWAYPAKYARAFGDLRMNLPAAVAGKAA